MAGKAGFEVAIFDEVPIARGPLESCAVAAGLAVESPDDLTEWLRSGPQRGVIVAIRKPEQARQIAHLTSQAPDRAVVAVVPPELTEWLRAVVVAGPTGVTVEDERFLPEALVHALEGRALLPMSDVQKLVHGRERTVEISDEELSWLKVLARDVSVVELAKSVGRSERDMYRRLNDLYVRLGVRNRSQALMQAARWGFLRPEDPDV